ncbi:MAG TPA: peptidylprolyl isomerase [Cyclobacteriaceae bacterium]|nr:peptidylprolyl isomerase [Cyclobacteriaceae bacterium]
MKYFLVCFLIPGFTGIHAQDVKKAKHAMLFTIDGKPTYTQEFVYLYKKNHPNKEQDYTSAKVEEYLNLFINFKLKVTEAHRRGLDTTAKFEKELKSYRDELKKPYRAEKDALEKLTRETYDHLTQEVKASHILIQLRPGGTPEDTAKAYNRILDIRKRIPAGEDFEKLARELSEDPSAKYNGGNLGYFTAMQMVYPFEEAAYQTKVGEISSIVKTQFGYHLIKVTDKRTSRGEVEVSHILLRSTKENDAKIKNLIFELYDQLKNGRGWDELCKQYSEDSNTKNAGGRLRPFGVGALAAVPEFEAAAFALQNPGDVSDPFQSNIGWHIVRLEKKIPLPLYAEVESSLKKRVARDERMKISEEAAALKRKRDLGVRENSELKKKILALTDSSLLKGKWKFSGNPELKNQVLITVNGKNANAGEFVAWLGQHQSSSKLAPAAFMEQRYQSWVDERISQAEEEKIVKENPDFQYLLTEYHEGILLFEIMEKEVWNKASDDSVGQRKYYNENVSKYAAGNRVEARIFSTSDKAFLEEVKSKIVRGDTLKEVEMKKFKSVQNFRKYEKGESKAIDRVSWVPGLQETEVDGTYYLIEVRRLVEPGPKSLDEARAKVISDYQNSLENTWMMQLRNKYRISINKKGRKVVLDELTKK